MEAVLADGGGTYFKYLCNSHGESFQPNASRTYTVQHGAYEAHKQCYLVDVYELCFKHWSKRS